VQPVRPIEPSPFTEPEVHGGAIQARTARPVGVFGLKLFLVCTVLAAVGMGVFGLMMRDPAVLPTGGEAESLAVEEPAVSVVPEVAEGSEDSKSPPPAVPEVLDAVRNPARGVEARRAAERAFKRNAQVIRKRCPDAVGQRIEIETVVSQGGRIQWARPLNRHRPEFKCVTENMRQVKSGSRLKIATKVRLHVQP
jgi:hypothetical protein